MSEQNKQYQAPTFTPPVAPTFTPPSGSSGRNACYYHANEVAVAQCVSCGKSICKDCYDSYGVSSGEYAGKSLCFDCTQQLVAQNVADLTRNKTKIKAQFILSIVGMAIGFIVGFAGGISSGSFGAALFGGLIYAGVGGVFLSVLKAFGSLLWDAIKIAFSGRFGWLTVLSLIFQSIVIMFKAVWVTITNTIYYIRYLKQTSGFIESDSQCLQRMKEYMEYTLIRDKNVGVDLDKLMQQGSELYNNSFAQIAREKGEAQVTAEARRCVMTIAENGEIIRSFAA